MSRPLHDADLQAGYLGAAVLNPVVLEAYPLALDDLWGPGDQAILGAMLALRARGEPVSTDGILVELQRHGRRVGVERILGITSRVDRDPAACARRLRQLARMRRMRDAALEAAAALESADDDGEATARQALARGAEVGDVADDERVTYRELQARGIEAAVQAAREQRDGSGFRFGTPSFDRSYTPRPGHLIFVGGRANVGKTSLTFAWHLDCARRGIPSDIVSVDDDSADYGDRAVFASSGISPSWLRSGERRLTTDDVRTMVDRAEAESALRIGFTKVRTMSVDGVVAAITRAVRVHGARWVSVDYLTKIRAPGKDQRERANEALHRLEQCAMLLGIPLVVLVQLNRGEGRDAEYREPTLRDFAESGEIEQRAKAAVMLWRKSDRAGEPVFAKVAKVKGPAGRRFWLVRHPDSGLLVECDEDAANEASAAAQGSNDAAFDGGEGWS